jgi:hypothetical protein
MDTDERRHFMYEEPEGGWPKCPRCKTPMEGPNFALSRVDDRTHICSSCGRKEGLWVFEHPDRELPAIENPIPSLT